MLVLVSGLLSQAGQLIVMVTIQFFLLGLHIKVAAVVTKELLLRITALRFASVGVVLGKALHFVDP